MIHNLAAMIPRNKNLIINRVFLPGLLLLLVNDHFLKLYYPNWLTGKLSDFAGLLIFPLFLAYLFPRQARHWPLITGLFFIYWKSPWSSPFIVLYNKLSPIAITRVVDYSDLLALPVLVLSWYLIPRCDRYAIRSYTPPAFWLVAPCSLIFMATEPPYYYRSLHEPKGDIYLHKTYHSRLTPQQVLDTLAKEGYAVRPDTGYHSNNYSSGPFYIIENIPLPQSRDTLKSVQFELKAYKTGSSLTVNNINLGETVNLGDWKMLRRYTRWYKARVKKYIIAEVE